jgi:hypothetical protein
MTVTVVRTLELDVKIQRPLCLDRERKESEVE